MKRHQLAIFLTTVYLVVYTTLHQFGAPSNLLGFMFALSPFLVMWMVYTVLKYALYNGRELKPDEEYGYGDREREDQ